MMNSLFFTAGNMFWTTSKRLKLFQDITSPQPDVDRVGYNFWFGIHIERDLKPGSASISSTANGESTTNLIEIL